MDVCIRFTDLLTTLGAITSPLYLITERFHFITEPLLTFAPFSKVVLIALKRGWKRPVSRKITVHLQLQYVQCIIINNNNNKQPFVAGLLKPFNYTGGECQ